MLNEDVRTADMYLRNIHAGHVQLEEANQTSLTPESVDIALLMIADAAGVAEAKQETTGRRSCRASGLWAR